MTVAIGLGMVLVGVLAVTAIARRTRRMSDESWSGESGMSRRDKIRDEYPGPPPSATYGQGPPPL